MLEKGLPKCYLCDPIMKKIVFSFIIVIYCVLIFSAGSNTWLKKTKLPLANDWSERGEMPEDSEESGQEDNREWQHDETFKVSFLYSFINSSFSKENNFSSFLFFAVTHFPEIDFPPPQA